MLNNLIKPTRLILDAFLIHPPADEKNSETIRLFFSISFLSLLGFAVLLIFSLISFFNQADMLAIFLLTIALLNICNYLFLRFTHQIVPALFAASLLMILIYFYLFLNGGYKNTGLYWCFVFAPLFFFFLGHKFGFLICLILTVSSALIMLNPDFPYLLAEYPEATRKRFPMIFGVISALLYIQEFSRFRVDKHNKILTEKLEQVARTDELSGLLNRRGAEEALKREFKRGRRSNRFASLVLVDIDHFKNINDNYGHDAGDFTIQSVAQCLLSVVRDNDYVARWGGEEFLLILTESHADCGYHVAERLRQSVADLDIGYNTKKISITISLGVACFDRDDDIEAVLKKTDIALYQSKTNGRNQVSICQSSKDQSLK